MGYDLVAYFDIDQDEIDRFIRDNTIDKDDWEQGKFVANYFTTKHLDINFPINLFYCKESLFENDDKVYGARPLMVLTNCQH